MSSSEDFYAILGVGRTATQAEITTAFRALVRRHHPDTGHEDPDTAEDAVRALHRVVAAYGVLRDTTRRAHYDGQLAAAAASSDPATAPEEVAPPIRSAGPYLRVGPVRRHDVARPAMAVQPNEHALFDELMLWLAHHRRRRP